MSGTQQPRPAPPDPAPSWIDYVCFLATIGCSGGKDAAKHARAELAELRELLAVYKETADVENAQWEKRHSEARKALAESQGKLAIATGNAAELAQQRDEALAEIKSKNKLLPSLLAEGVQMERERAIKAEHERDALRAHAAELRGAILGLGELTGTEVHVGWGATLRVHLKPDNVHTFNAWVSRLRAEAPGEEGKQ